MLVRSRILSHPSGSKIKTPLLVPSFSSKGFQFSEKNKSEVVGLINYMKEHLQEGMLVSGYDIHYEHTPRLKILSNITDITFIDSGGYETSQDHDLSTLNKYIRPAQNWETAHYEEVLSSWPQQAPAVFVSFDNGFKYKKLKSQIKSAKELFAKHPDQLFDFLLKPDSKKDLYLKIENVLKNIEELRGFPIIGFTEKDIGESLLARMTFVAQARHAFDKAEISSPIHIFGSLDPLSSWLYFLAGAEIFDGLTWLRYGYIAGSCLYYQNYAALEGVLQKEESYIRKMVFTNNLIYLDRLQSEMRSFVINKDFRKISFHSEAIESAYETLKGEVGGIV